MCRLVAMLDDAPYGSYHSAADGGSWRFPRRVLPQRFLGGASINVIVGEADAGFRWGIDLEHSPDGGRTWLQEVTLFSAEGGGKSGVFEDWPTSGALRLVVKVYDTNSVGRVFGTLSITVR